jgi:Restriction endonuclease S subunits
MSKFLDFFDPIQKGNTELTEMAVYNSIKFDENFVPLWGGNRSHIVKDRLISEKGRTKSGLPITIFDEEGIIISLDGSAGSMTYKNGERFSLNHHAGFFKVKKEMREFVNPEFFALFFENKLMDLSVSDGSKTLSLKQIYSFDFEMPDKKTQDEFISLVRPLLEKREHATKLFNKIESIKDKIISHEYREYQATDVNISGILDYMSGNSGLVEEEIYTKIYLEKKRYTILSSSTTEDTRMGEIPLCEIKGKKLKVFEDREGILVIRNGKAGTTFYLKNGKYTINDHAYILYLKDDCEYEISLKWIVSQYRKTFLEYSSSSDNGTWNMTGFFENVTIGIPSYKEQIEIANEYEKLEKLENSMKHVLTKIESIFQRQVSY